MKEYSVNIYILQERTIPNHVRAFDMLCRARGLEPRYHQFAMARPVLATLVKRDFRRLRIEVERLLAMLSLLPRLIFGPRALIVLGIAPFDFRITFLVPFLLRHSVYLHNSWPSWGPGEPVPKSWFLSISKSIWNSFVSKHIQGIFCVSEKTATSISAHFPSWPPCAVIGHTIDAAWFADQESSETKPWRRSVAYIGRLVAEKGIDELLALADALPDFQFHFFGNGPMEDAVRNSGLSNVIFHGYVEDSATLIKRLQACDVVAQPSRHSGAWVEAFGLGVLECMARGLIPVTTNSPGSLTVLGEELKFLTCPVADYQEHFLHIVKSLDDERCRTLRRRCTQRATYFQPQAVSERWDVLLSDSDAWINSSMLMK